MKILITYALEDERINVGFNNHEVVYLKTGIGKVNAAARLMQTMLKISPDIVINIGTAGTVNHDVGTIILCNQFVDRDIKSVNIPDMIYSIDMTLSTNKFINKNSSVQYGSCNTGDSFLTELEHADDDMYDMEAFAEAYVCKILGKPFISVKYATDKIGNNSIRHWKEKLNDARIALTQFFCENHIVTDLFSQQTEQELDK